MTPQKKYIFTKDYKSPYGVIKENTDFMCDYRGTLYMNGGMLSPEFQRMFAKLFANKKFLEEYIKEEDIVENKA